MADAPKVKEEQVPSRAPPANSPPAGAVSDPEEDDLSDLDDVLDEFANTKLDSKAPAPKPESTAAPSTSGPGRPEDVSPAELLLENEDEFAKQLQKEMEQLLGQGDFQKQFEDIMKEMSQEMGGANPLEAHTPHAKDAASGKAKEEGSSATTTQAEKESSAKAEKNFQETIKKTMERMQSSSDTATSAAASSSQDDMLAQMLAQMESGGFGGAEGGDEDFSKILMGMMEQLTNKEILYEPMKELDDKFPKWMEEHKDKTAKDDLARYEEQQTLVREIVGRFERKGYADSNAEDREYIVERMQKMQAAGSPPPDLVGDMNAAQEALQEIDGGCPTQ